jgi:hypothetical protein
MGLDGIENTGGCDVISGSLFYALAAVNISEDVTSKLIAVESQYRMRIGFAHISSGLT